MTLVAIVIVVIDLAKLIKIASLTLVQTKESHWNSGLGYTSLHEQNLNMWGNPRKTVKTSSHFRDMSMNTSMSMRTLKQRAKWSGGRAEATTSTQLWGSKERRVQRQTEVVA